MAIQYLLILAFVSALALTWKRARQGTLPKGQAALWSALWIASGVIVARPEVSTAVARVLGVGRGADVVVYLGLVAAFTLVFRLYVRLETLERQLTRLVREIALRDGGKGPHEPHA